MVVGWIKDLRKEFEEVDLPFSVISILSDQLLEVQLFKHTLLAEVVYSGLIFIRKGQLHQCFRVFHFHILFSQCFCTCNLDPLFTIEELVVFIFVQTNVIQILPTDIKVDLGLRDQLKYEITSII